MPTAARSAWIAVPIVLGDCMPEPDSVTQNVTLSGVSTPDCWMQRARTIRDRSCTGCTWSVYAHVMAGGIGPTDGVPVSLQNIVGERSPC